MGALTFAVLVVLGFDEVDTGASPLRGERIGVVHVQDGGIRRRPAQDRRLVPRDGWSTRRDGRTRTPRRGAVVKPNCS